MVFIIVVLVENPKEEMWSNICMLMCAPDLGLCDVM